MPEDHPRTLLLVDDEPNVLAALRRVLRRDGYTLLTSDDPHAALGLLDQHPVDVILSDQRMPGMSGVEFLRRVRETHPDTIRIVLSGYSDLQFITDAINEGAIYKFLTKPWDDELLRQQIRTAFAAKEAADENRRLTRALQAANARLEAQAQEQALQAQRLETALCTLQEVIQLIPWPLVGVDGDGLIALANAAADASLSRDGAPLLGRHVGGALPPDMAAWLLGQEAMPASTLHEGRRYRVVHRPMGRHSRAQGALLALLPLEKAHE